jgi:hypothetical protein
MSASLPKVDFRQGNRDVRSVPKADISLLLLPAAQPDAVGLSLRLHLRFWA